MLEQFVGKCEESCRPDNLDKLSLICLIIYISVEEIYKTNLDELADVVDGDVEAAVRSVRRKADKALESLKTTDGNGNNKGIKNF